jgi:hypothetical protein
VWVDLLGDRPVARDATGAVRLADLLGALPVALLVRHGSLGLTMTSDRTARTKPR